MPPADPQVSYNMLELSVTEYLIPYHARSEQRAKELRLGALTLFDLN